MSSKLSRTLGRIKRQAYLISQGHILNWPWLPREERRKRRYTATKNSTVRYLNRYKPFITGIRPIGIEGPEEPERAFSIWLQGEGNAPELVKACFRSMRKNLSLELIVLDKTNLFNWVEIPDYIIRKWKDGKMRAAHFCDVCRVDLLYRHGGIWLDATDLVTRPVPQWIMDEDFFMFMAGEKIRGSYSFVQNCFIRSRKGNELISIWREAILHYWKHENSVINYFTHQFLFMMAVKNNPTAARLFEKYPKMDQDPTHALWDAHKDELFDEEKYQSLTKDSFFQKTSFKSTSAKQPQPGTIAYRIINSR